MSAGVAALIALLTFWILLPYGWFWEELGVKAVVVFLILWAVGYFALPHIPYAGGAFFSYVALLDVALVFIIFKGDVRLN